jgi:predicted dehydrogenase
MSTANPHLLIIGLGSAGKRHARNLRALGCTVSGFDPRADRQQETGAEGPMKALFSSLDDALKTQSYDGFVIASPPPFHVDQIITAGAGGGWILCEKPLSIDASSCRRIADSGAKVLLGYTYRWWPPVAEFRRRLQSGLWRRRAARRGRARASLSFPPIPPWRRSAAAWRGCYERRRAWFQSRPPAH